MHSSEDDGIVVVEVGKDAVVELEQVPASLRERLGPGASAGLLACLDEARSQWSEDVMTASSLRFGRQLADETSKFRIEIAQGFAAIREELARGLGEVRQEMAGGLAALRQEMTKGDADLREAMLKGDADLRDAMLKGNADLREAMLKGDADLREAMLNGDADLREAMTKGTGDLRAALADQKFEILKWVFVFWTGQFFVTASFVLMVIRALRP